MNALLLMVRRSLRQHWLSTLVTVLSTALATGLTISVFSVAGQTRDAFVGCSLGFDAVVGARSSPSDVVLSSLYHVQDAPGKVPWATYQELRRDPAVELAVPYAVGDNYRGWRIIGTTPDLFAKAEARPGRKFETCEGGRWFDASRREAVIGSTVAAQTGLTVGSAFHAYHGLDFLESSKHEGEFLVVGVLTPTNTPCDRALFIPIEGIYRMKGHALLVGGQEVVARPGEAIPDEAKDVTAVLLRLRDRFAGIQMAHRINVQGKVATMAYPVATVVAQLFEKLGWMVEVLRTTACLVVVVAAGSILASLYNTMNERRREFAILRALGARRRTVFGAIVLESTTIAAMGCALGVVFHAAILGVTAVFVRRSTGVVLDAFVLHTALWAVPVAMTGVGALSGLLPAWNAYRTDVAENLAPTS